MADDPRRLRAFAWAWGAVVLALLLAPADRSPAWLEGEAGAVLGLVLLGALWCGSGLFLRLADRARSHRRAPARD